MRFRSGFPLLAALALACAGPRGAQLDVWKQKEIAEEAWIYAFPMLAAYKAMYEFDVDRGSSQFKAPFNQIWNAAHVATPADTAIVTPNSDTPYSMVQLDLRAEPMVICVPEVDEDRYYSVQLVDMYTFNYGYIGSRASGNGGGCFLVSGPDWKGAKPPGIAKAFASETQFSFVIFRTQLFDPADIENVKKIQAGYAVKPLSSFLGQPAPPPAPAIDFPKFTDAAFKTDFIAQLNFLLQFAPTQPEEVALRERFAKIGIGPGKVWDFESLPLEDRLGIGLGIEDGYDRVEKRVASIGDEVNGWHIGSAFGDRAFFKGDWELRAAAAMAGVYGNDAAEALYPMTRQDGQGKPLDGSRYRYTLTFPKGELPPVNAFWSVTMYDGKTQLLVANPIDRYLINSPMLPQVRKNPDGSLTLYIQKDSPGKAKESNWLPAPNGPIYLVMRLYWPKPPALDGEWKPAPVLKAQ